MGRGAHTLKQLQASKAEILFLVALHLLAAVAAVSVTMLQINLVVLAVLAAAVALALPLGRWEPLALGTHLRYRRLKVQAEV